MVNMKADPRPHPITTILRLTSAEAPTARPTPFTFSKIFSFALVLHKAQKTACEWGVMRHMSFTKLLGLWRKHLIFSVSILISINVYGGIGPGITETSNGQYKLKADGSSWSLPFPKSDYKVLQSKHRSNGRSRYFHLSNNEGVNISFFIEPPQSCTSSSDCRAYQIEHPSQSMIASVDVRNYEVKDFSIVYYMLEKADETMVNRIPELAGEKINQMNINAHYVRDGYWVDIHMSKMFSTPKDEAGFKEFVSSIRILEE